MGRPWELSRRYTLGSSSSTQGALPCCNSRRSVLGLHQFNDLEFYPDQTDSGQALKSQITSKDIKEKIMTTKTQEKKLPSAAERNQKKGEAEEDDSQWKNAPSLQRMEKPKLGGDVKIELLESSEKPPKSSAGIAVEGEKSEKVVDGKRMMICRICDFEIPIMHAEEHFKVCSIADRCDSKGLSVDERLLRVTEILEKILDDYKPKEHEEVSRDGFSSECGEFQEPTSTRNNKWPSTIVGQCLPNRSTLSDTNVL